jgi:hypothetical protein
MEQQIGRIDRMFEPHLIYIDLSDNTKWEEFKAFKDAWIPMPDDNDELDYSDDSIFPTRGLIPEVDKIRDEKMKK